MSLAGLIAHSDVLEVEVTTATGASLVATVDMRVVYNDYGAWAYLEYRIFLPWHAGNIEWTRAVAEDVLDTIGILTDDAIYFVMAPTEDGSNDECIYDSAEDRAE